MFYNCSSLKSIDLSSFNTEKVNNMSNMFAKCSSLISLDLSKFNTNKVKHMNRMFYFCTSLKSINISSFNTKSIVNFMFSGMSEMFFGCSSLKMENVIYNLKKKDKQLEEQLIISLYMRDKEKEQNDLNIINTNLKDD